MTLHQLSDEQRSRCKDCKPHRHSSKCHYNETPCSLLESTIELCPRHALTERLAEALRNYHYAAHNSVNCGSGCPASLLLIEYDSASTSKGKV